jgi:hypothetical protein
LQTSLFYPISYLNQKVKSPFFVFAIYLFVSCQIIVAKGNGLLPVWVFEKLRLGLHSAVD